MVKLPTFFWIFNPELWGKIRTHFEEHIFQRGWWFNRQLGRMIRIQNTCKYGEFDICTDLKEHIHGEHQLNRKSSRVWWPRSGLGWNTNCEAATLHGLTFTCFLGLARFFSTTPWKINGWNWNLQITHVERKVIWTKPPGNYVPAVKSSGVHIKNRAHQWKHSYKQAAGDRWKNGM